MKKWKTIIKPKVGLFELQLKELWQYKSLIVMLVSRNYKIQYKQTILGPAWIFINVLLSSGLFSLVFGYIGKFSSDGLPYFLFYMSASILWSFFSGCVSGNSGVFINNAYVFGKVYFPRLVVPVSNVIFELVRFGLQFCIFIIIWILFYSQGKVQFMGIKLLWIPCLIIIMALLGMSIGMIVSSLTTKYRDLNHCIGFGLQVLMYASPILYPISQLPDFLKPIVLLNPTASVIETFRYILTGSGTIHFGALAYSTIMTGIVTLIALVMFNQTEKNFIDIV